MNDKVNIRLHNAMIEVAFCEFWENKIAETDWGKDGEHKFSDRHTKQIKAIIKKHKAGERRKSFIRVVKRAAVVILILCAVSSAVLASSAEAREFVHRIRTNVIALFIQENPGVPPVGDEFMDWQTDQQIEQLENAIADALKKEGFPKDTALRIHVNGYLTVRIHSAYTGLSMEEADRIKPYIEPMASILSTAYASKNKNQIYYVQSVISSYREITNAPEGTYEEGVWDDALREYRQTIDDFMLENNYIDEEQIMRQPRVIDYIDGKLVFELK